MEAVFETSNLPATEAVASKNTLSSTSTPPDMNTSLAALIIVVLVADVLAKANLLYAADANPPVPTCIVLANWPYEAEAVPWTSRRVEGVVVLMPKFLFKNLPTSDELVVNVNALLAPEPDILAVPHPI